jgi:hypothetical protein
MNDELIIRLRPRRSKHGPNENPRKYIGVLRSMLQIVQMSKRGQKTSGTHSVGGSGRAQRTLNQRVAVAPANCEQNTQLAVNRNVGGSNPPGGAKPFILKYLLNSGRAFGSRPNA